MASGDEPTSLGPWKDANLRVTAQAGAGTGADAGVPYAVRFRSTIAKLVRRRLAVRGDAPDASSVSVFLLMPSPPDAAAAFSPKRVPRLDNGMEEISGRIWFVGAGPGSGHWIAADFEDDDALFSFITDTLNLGSAAAIVYDPQHPEVHIRHYPNGLADLESFDDVSLANASVTVDAVTEAIETTHVEMMITPDAQPSSMELWCKPNKWWPVRNAEARVQGYLKIALNTAFPTCTIRSEQPTPEGRLDIEIVENDPIDRTKVMQHGILELKVLRSFGESGRPFTKTYTSNWVKSGVEQAAAYRDSKGAAWGALICFDMRCEDVGDGVCFKHVRSLANKLQVHLRRWFIYGTSKQWRSALAAAKT